MAILSGGLRARLATLAILGVVFGAGLVVGVAVDRQVVSAADAPPSTRPAENDRERDRDRGDREGRDDRDDRDDGDERRRRTPMIERVGLSETQKQEVDSIFRSWGGRMSDLHKEYRSHYWEVVDSTRAAMRRVLTPEQAAAYDSLVAESDRRRRPNSVTLPRN